MSAFLKEIAPALRRDRRGRRWVYVAYDQLTTDHGPLHDTAPSELGVVMLENPFKAARRPYHKQKLAIVLANGRHFACEPARRGVALRFGVVGQ
jgi:deoxyribodipyrimidine photolyase-related protein